MANPQQALEAEIGRKEMNLELNVQTAAREQLRSMEGCGLEGAHPPGGSAPDAQVRGGPSHPQTVLGPSCIRYVKRKFGHRQTGTLTEHW